jgi:hypothetical protein
VQEPARIELDAAAHRRILNFLNEATLPEELAYERVVPSIQASRPNSGPTRSVIWSTVAPEHNARQVGAVAVVEAARHSHPWPSQ